MELEGGHGFGHRRRPPVDQVALPGPAAIALVTLLVGLDLALFWFSGELAARKPRWFAGRS